MVSGVVVNVLGPLEVRRDGALVPIEGLKRRQLLAVLVAARGAEVSVDRLGEALWDGEPPDSVRATLQSHVSRLRRSLAPDPLVRAGGVGYAIDVAGVELDAIRFEELADAAASEEPDRGARTCPRPVARAPRSASSPSCPLCGARRCGSRSCD